jgi:hypothetical protein
MLRETRGAKSKTGAALFSGLMLLVLGASSGCGMLKGNEEKKALGQACTQDADCASASCSTYGNVCSKSCAVDSECGESLVCRIKDGGGGSQCAKPIGARTGLTCAKASECDHGLCLKPQGASATDGGYCSQTCAASTDCPTGFTNCAANPNDANAKACQNADDRIKIGDTAPTATPAPGVMIPRPTTAAPDAGTPTPDAGTSTPDAGTPKPDAGTTPPPDAGTPTPDAGRTRPKIELKPRQ